MKELMMSDLYEISSSYPIDNVHYRTINLMYQPLIGNVATSLYFSLWAELDQLSLSKSPCLYSRLTKITNLSLRDIEASLKKLEGIGLINTYVKNTQEVHYLYELMLPLTPSVFINNQILNNLLYKILGKEDYHRTLLSFKVVKVDLDNYKNITASFNEVFDINFIDGKTPILITNDYLSKENNMIENQYQLDLFYEGLKDYQIKKNTITKKDEAIIKQLGILYKINAIDMQGIVKQCIFDDKLDHKSLIKECRNYFDLKMPETFSNIHHTQSIKHQSVISNDTIDAHVSYLQSITPYKLLKDKQGGKEPLKRDLVVIESVMTTLDLEPGVVNVLIELTLSQCDNTLPRSFLEAVGASWKRKKVVSVVDAIEESKKYLKSKNYDKPEWSNNNDVNKIFDNKDEAINEDELNEFLAKYD